MTSLLKELVVVLFLLGQPSWNSSAIFSENVGKLGFSSEIDFAKAVVDSSVNERQEMLKRFYVDKNPVLSGLSCFTAGSERSAVAADNERQDLKRAKRSLE